MEDSRIIELYWQRNEKAIFETKRKHGPFCYGIAYRILKNAEDAAECENDTYLEVWNTIPPKRPTSFSSYIGTITRNRALDHWRKKYALKRGKGDFIISIDELEECVPDGTDIAKTIEIEELAHIISDFLNTLPETECNVFLQRYWYFYSIKEISQSYDFSQSKVKMMLLRTRGKLREHLVKEGVFIEIR